MRNPKNSNLRTGRTLHVGCPNVGNRKTFDTLVDEIFESRWFTNDGKFVKQFESRLCDHLGVRHCIPICNATLGLQIACRAMDLRGEIILPAFTFIASPHSVTWESLQPVFADVNPVTHTLCPESVRSLINDRTSAIMGVHLWGNPCLIEALQSIADEHELKLIFDAAHAFHSKYQGTMIGNFGDCEVFSFHATKFFNTFEGGAIATNNDQLAKKIRHMKNFGFDGPGRIACLGTNAKMPEISAAMGISMFASLQQIAEKNQNNYAKYRKRFNDAPGVKLFSLDHLEQTNWQYIVIEIDEHQFGCTRDHVLKKLKENRVLAKPYFSPGCHRLEPYKEAFRQSDRQLPVTDALCDSVLCLPTGTAIHEQDIDEICDIIMRCSSVNPLIRAPFATISQKAAG